LCFIEGIYHCTFICVTVLWERFFFLDYFVVGVVIIIVALHWHTK
jgi:hypothetical protein